MRTMSASPCCSMSSCAVGSATCRVTTRLTAPATRGVRSSTTDSFARQPFSTQGPEPALFCRSQALPMSPSAAWDSTASRSTMLATLAVRQYCTKLGAWRSAVRSSSVRPSAWMRSSTLPGVKPNCPRMKAGDLFILIARWNENAASAAVTGRPVVNFAPSRSTKLWVSPSSLTRQLSASSPCRRLGSCGSTASRCW